MNEFSCKFLPIFLFIGESLTSQIVISSIPDGVDFNSYACFYTRYGIS
jgi:hypothetical protein